MTYLSNKIHFILNVNYSGKSSFNRFIYDVKGVKINRFLNYWLGVLCEGVLREHAALVVNGFKISIWSVKMLNRPAKWSFKAFPKSP